MECVLRNKRHETFCWLMAGGTMDPVEAFRKAGYKGGLGWLWRLLNREDIGRRLIEIGGLLKRLLIVPLRAGADRAVESVRAVVDAAQNLLKGGSRAVETLGPAVVGVAERPELSFCTAPMNPRVNRRALSAVSLALSSISAEQGTSVDLKSVPEKSVNQHYQDKLKRRAERARKGGQLMSQKA
ncbi:MAG: hypothetical protein LBR29_10420 [Methylobacteriaceae bacterium]|jgi:hypothetical protein|nr:hypothetical protein [Methylobacteriaceae bacterium]